MKNRLLASVATSALILSTQFVWAHEHHGSYAGVIAARANFSNNADFTVTDFTGSVTGFNAEDIQFIGGVFIGHNFDLDDIDEDFLFGIEGDIYYLGSETDPVTRGKSTYTSEVDWLATLRARTGFYFDDLLIFGTAGVAFVDYQNTLTQTGPGPDRTFTQGGTDVGFVFGAGFDYFFVDSRFVRVEYERIEFDADAPNPAGGKFSTDSTIDLFKFSVGFQF